MISGYYGKSGAMTEGWDTKEEADEEINAWYQDDKYLSCFVTEYNGEWVIAYD